MPFWEISVIKKVAGEFVVEGDFWKCGVLEGGGLTGKVGREGEEKITGRNTGISYKLQ